MRKKQRHERKKIERTRYRRSLSHSESARSRRSSRSVVRDGAKALAAAAAIAGGTQAYATPVRFENPPGPEHFIWVDKQLDVADPASVQGASTDPSAFRQILYGDYASSVYGNTDGGDLQVRQDFNQYYFLIGFDGGDIIPSTLPWRFYGLIDIVGYSQLPEGVATYLGVRFNPGDGLHYGWIGVTRTEFALDAFAWGYETDPGVPIAAGVPEPGTLAMLAFGGGTVSLRRRRSYSN